MSTELVQLSAEEQMMAAFGLDAGSIKPSALEIVALNQAEKNKPAGSLYDPQTKEVFEKMALIVIKIQNGKVLFASEELGQKPLCRSNDGLTPEPSTANAPYLVPQAKQCAKCPMNQWKVIGGKKIRPQCSDTRTLLVMDTTTSIPYRLKLKRSAVPEINNFKSALVKKVTTARSQGQNVSPLHFQAELETILVTKGGYKYYVPNFGEIHRTDPQATINAFQIFQKWGGLVLEEEETDEVDKAIDNATDDGTTPPFDI